MIGRLRRLRPPQLRRRAQDSGAQAGFARRRLRQASLGGAGNKYLARYVAPAAFLLAVTAVVLVVRSTLRSNKPAATTASVTTRPAPAATRPRPAPAPRRYYVIRSGDTLDGIAARFATTVTELLRLNPGVQPTALTPGRQVRVK